MQLQSINTTVNHKLSVKNNISNTLSSDFWVIKEFYKNTFPELTEPIKFELSVFVFVAQGHGRIDINLIPFEVTSPSIVCINPSQIVQVRNLSDDFTASCILYSKRFSDNMFTRMKDCHLYSFSLQHNVAKVPKDLVKKFKRHIKLLYDIAVDKENPYAYQAAVLTMSSFFYHTGYKCYERLAKQYPKYESSRIPDKFISLVQLYYKKERFLDFYADKMGITPKHLSRTMKTLTGFSATEWIERFVVLEAKVLLKSTNLNIQEISEKLNFQSQSVFGKYFKKKLGMSPKEFRNS